MDIKKKTTNKKEIKMTITLMDLYNSAATQEWAMYDNDAVSDSEFEDSLVLAINKAVLQVFLSYDFPFRERTHVILTIPKIPVYDMPSGIIKKNQSGNYSVKYNSKEMTYISDFDKVSKSYGIPNSFTIKNDKLILHPVPKEKGIVTIDYMTLVIGETAEGEEIYSLKNSTDILSVPVYLEEIAKEAIITRTMLNSIASESDENYSAYKKQADKAYKLLVKYSKGVGQDKRMMF